MLKNKMIVLEDQIMVDLIRALQSLGGQATRQEIKRAIRRHSQSLTKDIMDEVRTSKRTGRTYRPFDLRFGFAVHHLTAAGYLTKTENHQLQLLEKGRTVELTTFDPTQDVRPLSEGDLDKLAPQHAPLPSTPNEEDAEAWRTELLMALHRMSPKKFELFCRGLLTQMGITLDERVGVKVSHDGGLDGFGYVTADDFRTTRVALQAKRWEGRVPAPEIDKFRGAMDKHRAEYGLFITTADFTREAVAVAMAGTRIITLINGEQICDLVAKYHYYVTPVLTYQLGDFYLEED